MQKDKYTFVRGGIDAMMGITREGDIPFLTEEEAKTLIDEVEAMVTAYPNAFKHEAKYYLLRLEEYRMLMKP